MQTTESANGVVVTEVEVAGSSLSKVITPKRKRGNRGGKNRPRNARVGSSPIGAIRAGAALAHATKLLTTATGSARHALGKIAAVYLPVRRLAAEGAELVRVWDGFVMAVRSSRVLSVNHGVTRMQSVLAFYRPVIDLPGTGRVAMTLIHTTDALDPQGCDAIDARDVTRAAVLLGQAVEDTEDRDLVGQLPSPAFYYAFPPESSPVFESRYSYRDWATSEVRIGPLRAWPSIMFVRSLGDRFETSPVDGSPDPWLNEEPASTELGSWVRRGGNSYPASQMPHAVYVDFAAHRGRVVRNPAFQVLLRHNLLVAPHGYAAWRNSVTKAVDGARVVLDPTNSTTATYSLRDRIASYLTDSDREQALLEDLESACAAMDIPTRTRGGPQAFLLGDQPISAAAPRNSDAGRREEFLLRLLESPWTPVAVPSETAISVVRLTGDPAPATMDFVGADYEARLFDISQ